jgi:hypothetical protein
VILETNLLVPAPDHSLPMGLSEIAAGVEVTSEQVDRGVATVDDTGVAPDRRLREFEADLPCTAAAAGTVLEEYRAGADIGTAATAAAIAPVTAAKLLHRCGFEGLTPLSPTAGRVLDDWLEGRLARTEALALTGATDAEFALAAYIETHDPLEELAAAIRRDATEPLAGDAAVSKRDALAGTMSGADDLR